MTKGWKVEHINDVPPKEDSYTKGWKSIRWHMGIDAFGVNAIAREKGEWLTKEHDEVDTDQQELFIITEGQAEFTVDGKKFKAGPGTLVAVTDPRIKRGADALVTPTTMLIIGGPAGKVYKPPSWA